MKTEHFQISVLHQPGSEETAFNPETREPASLRIMKLSDKDIVPTKGSPLEAGHDIYSLTDGLVPAKGQRVVETGIAIGLPGGTYRRLSGRSGMTSKIGRAVGRGVTDADYNGEIKVILRNHGLVVYLFKARDRIAQLLIERIADPDDMELDELEPTEGGKLGFRSCSLNPKRSIRAKDQKVKICFLHGDTGNNEFFSTADISYYPP